ncbi:MAG: 7TM diverse intracellular signaling domain-containing protein, partial [Ginsengibacter sp.]
MKKIFLSSIVCLFFITKIVAQNNLPAGEAGLPTVYEISSDTAYQQELSHTYYQVLDDKAGNWTIEQVNKPPLSNQFRDRNFKPQGVDTSVSTYWFRYILKNTTGHDISIALDAYGEKDDFYLFDSTGKITHYLTGWEVPWSKKNGIKVSNAIPLKMKVNEKLIIYNRMYNKEPGIFAGFKIIFFNNEKNLTKLFIENQDDYYQANSYFRVLLTGFLLISALFNFFFFLTVKEKMYLYFSLFLITLSFVSSEFIIEVLAREHYQLAQIVDIINSVLALFFLVHFIRHYFQTFVFTQRWDKFLIVISFVFLIYSSITALFPALPKPFLRVVLILIVIIIISTFITLIKFKRLHHSNVKDFIIAVSPFLIMIATVILMSVLFLITKQNSISTGI